MKPIDIANAVDNLTMEINNKDLKPLPKVHWIVDEKVWSVIEAETFYSLLDKMTQVGQQR